MPRSICFVHSPLVEFGQNYGVQLAPLWALTLAAYVPATFATSVVDCRTEDPARLARADVFAFSGLNQDLETLLGVQALLKAKHPGALFILGGPIVWSFQQEGRLDLLAAFDYLFLLEGEQTLPLFLSALEHDQLAELPRLLSGERFRLSCARRVDFELYQRGGPERYQGAAIEVSRGCPFLCEFCDIRSVRGNNVANNKSIDVIVDELGQYHAQGVTQFMFVCDNFIGDPAWARACAEAICAFRAQTGARLEIFTWATLNLAKQPELMKLLRRAGFSVLYIGVESVNQAALLETAKLQNRCDMQAAITRIHAHGFIIAPGIIFGFDSDTPAVFEETLAFVRDAGLIGGDPSFLSALPGTPLFDRMQRTQRLVPPRQGSSERRKIATNVRYLLDRGFWSDGFSQFVRVLCSPEYQLARFERHLQQLTESTDFVSNRGAGVGSPGRYLRQQCGQPENRRMLLRRVRYLLRPKNLYAAARGCLAWLRAERTRPGLALHFHFWIYLWTNLALKYDSVTPDDFELHSVLPGTRLADLAQDAMAALIRTERLLSRSAKSTKQARATSMALERLATTSPR